MLPEAGQLIGVLLAEQVVLVSVFVEVFVVVPVYCVEVEAAPKVFATTMVV